MTHNHSYTPLESIDCKNKKIKSHNKVLSSKDFLNQIISYEEFVENLHNS